MLNITEEAIIKSLCDELDEALVLWVAYDTRVVPEGETMTQRVAAIRRAYDALTKAGNRAVRAVGRAGSSRSDAQNRVADVIRERTTLVSKAAGSLAGDMALLLAALDTMEGKAGVQA